MMAFAPKLPHWKPLNKRFQIRGNSYPERGGEPPKVVEGQVQPNPTPAVEERGFAQRRRGTKETHRRKGDGAQSPGRRPPIDLNRNNQERLRRNHNASASLFFLSVSA